MLLGSRTLNKRMSLFIEGLLRDGFDVRLWSAPRGRWSADRFEAGTARLEPGFVRSRVVRSDAASRIDSEQLTSQQRFSSGRTDVVLCFHWAMLPIAVAVRFFCGARLVYDEFDFYELNTLEGAGPNWLRNICGWTVSLTHRVCVPFADLVTCIHMAKGILKRRLQKWNSNVVELHNYPTRDWHRTPESSEANGRVSFVFVGGIYKVKGCAAVADAFARLQESRPDSGAELHFFGRGDAALTASLKQQAGVTVHDDCRPVEIRRFLHSRPCIGLMLYQDGPRYRILGTNSRKMFEYLATGAAVIATALGEVRQIVSSNELGWLVSPDATANELAAVMQQIIDNRDERIRRCENAAQWMQHPAGNWEAQWARLANAPLPARSRVEQLSRLGAVEGYMFRNRVPQVAVEATCVAQRPETGSRRA